LLLPVLCQQRLLAAWLWLWLMVLPGRRPAVRQQRIL
jgi:hypothetical protein